MQFSSSCIFASLTERAGNGELLGMFYPCPRDGPHLFPSGSLPVYHAGDPHIMISLRTCATLYPDTWCLTFHELSGQPGWWTTLPVYGTRYVQRPTFWCSSSYILLHTVEDCALFILRQFSCDLGSNCTGYRHTRPPWHGLISALEPIRVIRP